MWSEWLHIFTTIIYVNLYTYVQLELLFLETSINVLMCPFNFEGDALHLVFTKKEAKSNVLGSNSFVNDKIYYGKVDIYLKIALWPKYSWNKKFQIFYSCPFDEPKPSSLISNELEPSGWFRLIGVCTIYKGEIKLAFALHIGRRGMLGMNPTCLKWRLGDDF